MQKSFDLGRVDGAEFALVMVVERTVDQHLPRLYLRSAFGENEFRVLHARQRLAEDVAVLDVGNGLNLGSDCSGLGADCDRQSFLGEIVAEVVESASFFAQQIPSGTRTSSKYSSAVSCAFNPSFDMLRTTAKPGRGVSRTRMLRPAADWPGRPVRSVRRRASSLR